MSNGTEVSDKGQALHRALERELAAEESELEQRLRAAIEEQRQDRSHHCVEVLMAEVEYLAGRALDLSPCGAGLVLGGRLESGRLLVVELRSTNRCALLALPVRVAHATRQPDGTWLTGCAFLQPTSAGIIRRLL